MTFIPPFVAILVCDTQIETLKKFGDFGDQAITLFRSAGLTDCEFRKYDVIEKMEYPTAEELAGCKGIYLTGSRSDSFDSLPWIVKLRDFLRLCLNEYEFPITASCFGHQIIATALDMQVTRSPEGWEMGLMEIKLNPEIQIGSLASNDSKNTVTVMEMHQDIVVGELPEGYANVGSTDGCKYQGIYKKNKLLTFQGHPEFTTDCGNILVDSRLDAGKITKETYDDAMGRNSKLSNDGVRIGKCMVDLLNGAL
ncbi:hypothetical protein OGAPHI_006351 [Ogataea philodendri]|uniref:Glutamine amidotransferase domain-containing protein n=1 Tax=Ogataea philodendri TaxID=1378263 RepID=A0A9P8T0T5_9ASCO|nr:uncharacterized protein OGAPHI_006351 [Ogataea philodendri]KAH3661504.1 hypothetical protein OGAPHI_006351 [Ogataea philodendri]